MLTPTKHTRNIKGLTHSNRENACHYLKEQVDNWIKNYSIRKFSLADLLHEHGVSSDWNEIPLQPLFDNRLNNHSSDPYKVAASDAGYLLIEVLNNHTRNFTFSKGYVTYYNLI